EAAFAGEHLTLEPSWAWPKPVQRPHPPIVLGAKFGPRTVADLVAFCDGWLPHGVSAFPEQATQVRQALEDAGRDPATCTISIFGARVEERMVQLAAAAGADRVVFAVGSNEPEQVLEDLEAAATFVQ